jgi:hypothetical protein
VTRRAALVVLGLALGALAAAVGPARPAARPAPPWPALADLGPGGLQDETEGRLGGVIVHYRPDMAAELAPIYSVLFASLEPETTVYVAVTDEDHYEHLLGRLKSAGRAVRPILQPVCTGREISGWAKDRFAAWLPRGSRRPVLLTPPRPAVATSARIGDWHVPGFLAASYPWRFGGLELPVRFDGGDFAAADDLVLAGPCLLRANRALGDSGRRASADLLEHIAGRRVLLLGGRKGLVPEHHVNMFALPLGRRRVLVGDARMAVDLLGGEDSARRRLTELGLEMDLSARSAARFDRAAELLRAEGLEVSRVPVLAAAGPLAYRPCITYTNAFIEELDGDRAVYLAQYGIPELDRAAVEAYRRMGLEPRPVPVGRIWLRGGSLDCLVGVLSRTPPSRGRR